MAYSIVQSVNATAAGGTVNSGAFGASTTAGNALVAFVYQGVDAARVVTLSGQGTWTKETQLEAGAGWYLDAAIMLNITGGATTQVSASFSGSTYRSEIFVCELSGIATSSARLGFSAATTYVGNASNFDSGLLGTLSSQPAALIGVGMGRDYSHVGPTVGSGFTDIGVIWGGHARAEHKRLTATTSVAAVFVSGQEESMVAAAFALLESAGGSTQAPRALHQFRQRR